MVQRCHTAALYSSLTVMYRAACNGIYFNLAEDRTVNAAVSRSSRDIPAGRMPKSSRHQFVKLVLAGASPVLTNHITEVKMKYEVCMGGCGGTTQTCTCEGKRS